MNSIHDLLKRQQMCKFNKLNMFFSFAHVFVKNLFEDLGEN